MKAQFLIDFTGHRLCSGELRPGTSLVKACIAATNQNYLISLNNI